MATKHRVESAEHAHLAVEVASDKQAANIVMLNVASVSDFTDFFVILTSDSSPHMNALVDEIEKALKLQGASLHHREGTPESGWILLDFGDLIVHIFRQKEREFYQLDRLWSQAQEVVRIQ